MQLDENKRYTSREIIEALNNVQSHLGSEIGAVGRVVIDNKEELLKAIDKLRDIVAVNDDWRKEKIAIENDRRLRQQIDKNPNLKIITELLKLLGWALLIIGAILKVSL